MPFPPALLEDWMRQYYFAVDADLGSSGVEDFGFRELRNILGIEQDGLDDLVLHDSHSLGGAGLREAVADRWGGGDVDRVMVTHGSSEANFLLMHALLRPGDKVVVLDPVYPQLRDVAAALGCTIQRWHMRPEDGWRPDVDAGCALLRRGTRMIVLNFPHNPTGATLRPDELDALVAAADRAGAWLVWDAAFAALTYDAPPLPDPALRYARAISLGTLSKGYGLPGLRIGWCIADPAVLDAMVQVRDYLTLHLSPLVERIAEHAVRGADRLLEPRLETARRNRARVDAWIRGQDGALTWSRPEGGVCGFPRLEGGVDVDAFCHMLSREYRVLLVPGSCFGYPDHVRLGFGGASARLDAGLIRFAAALGSAGAYGTAFAGTGARCVQT